MSSINTVRKLHILYISKKNKDIFLALNPHLYILLSRNLSFEKPN